MAMAPGTNHGVDRYQAAPVPPARQQSWESEYAQSRPRTDDRPRHTGTQPRVHDDRPRHTGTQPRIQDDRPRHTGTQPRIQDDRPRHTGTQPVIADDPGEWIPSDGAAHRAVSYHPDVPEPPDRGKQLLVRLAFWFTLVASVELWWLDTPARSVTSTADILTAAGRITGMVAGFLLLVQVLMMSRVGWLERLVGAHTLIIWHRELGGALLLLVLGHVGLILCGYAAISHESLPGEAWSMLTTFEDMISATIATAILVAIGILAIRALRRRMPYELWYLLHMTSYLVLLLSYGHQFADGQELSKAGFGRWYWVSLYAFVILCLAWGRILRPTAVNLRHRLRVADVVPEGVDMISIYVSGRNLDDLDARAGQYFRWRFLSRGCWWQAHPFSLSAAPNGRWLRLTVKVVGNHTADLRRLKVGTRVWAEGPSGVFTTDRRVRPHALLIAAGSGIAPIRALLEDLPPGAVVIYRAGSESDIVFKDELDWLARRRSAQVWYVLGSRTDPGPATVFTPKGLRELVPDVRRRDVYLCGPEGLVSGTVKNLRRLRVPRRQIHLDPFEF
jgi:predicted ferric reductase